MTIVPTTVNGYYYIACTTCEAEGPSADNFTEAYERWDTRLAP